MRPQGPRDPNAAVVIASSRISKTVTLEEAVKQREKGTIMNQQLFIVVGATTLLSLVVALATGAELDRTGGDRRQLLEQALLAEIDGDAALRTQKLDQALEVEPQLAPARWHAGQIRLDGRWLTVRESQEEARADRKLYDYHQRRAGSDGGVRSQINLARWCERNGLAEPARAHWSQVLFMKPDYGPALAALDVDWHGGSLHRAAEAERQREAAQRRQERIEALKQEAAQWVAAAEGEPHEHTKAVRAVEALADFDAVTALRQQLAAVEEPTERHESLHLALIKALGRATDPWVGRLLIDYTASTSKDIRSAAIYELSQRPWHDYVPYLLSQMSSPVELDSHISEIGGGIANSYTVSRETPSGQRYEQTYYQAPRTPNVPRYAPTYSYRGTEPGYEQVVRDRLPCGGFTERVVRVPPRDRYEYSGYSTTELPQYTFQKQMAYQLAQRDAAGIAQQVAQVNSMIETHNEKIASVLTETTGVERPPTARAWWDWWKDYLEKNPDARDATIRHGLPFADEQVRHPLGSFPAGTLVWTRLGPKRIEDLRVGDEALSQDPETGELSYKAIAYIEPVGSIEMRELDLSQRDRLITPPNNLVWATGQGWRPARDLEASAQLRSFDGSRLLRDNRDGGTHPAYRLMVLDFHTLFVGREGVLVHDAAPVRVTNHILPGLAQK